MVLSQFGSQERCNGVNALSNAVIEVKAGDEPFDLEEIFRAQYERIVRIIARVVRNRARAEELAVEVFLKLWKNRSAQGEKTDAWLYRVAVRMALDELRRRTRHMRYQSLLNVVRRVPTAEDIHLANQEQEKVRAVLNAISRRHAELLVLRSHDLSYEEVALALGVKVSSVGTLLSRAQQTFRKEYVKRYGRD